MPETAFNSFAIFATMRSGSNLLERLINQYDGVHCHGELFNKGFIGASDRQEYMGMTRAERDKNPPDLLAAIRQQQPDIIHGYRIFGDHIDSMIEATLQDRSCAKIILRRNPVDSFVSLNIARKTNQWLIHHESDRKPARISFNLRQYRQYLDGLEAYYTRITDALTRTGQRFFEIDYDQLADIDALNRMAAFIGNCPPKDALEQPIKRQNPGSLAEKILNYDEVRQALNLPEAPPDMQIRETGTPLSRIRFCNHAPLAFAPVPGAPSHLIDNWINGFDGYDDGFGEDRLQEWCQTRAHPVAFCVTRHPLERAYDGFMRKIFDVGPGSYLAIRETLIERYALALPRPEWLEPPDRHTLKAQGYGVAQHRVAFKQFLTFVAANLKGETDIRQDGKWQQQAYFVAQYREIFPDLLHFAEPDLRLGLMYLQNRLDQWGTELPAPEPPAPFVFTLSEIHDAEIDTLAATCYGQDFDMFGYGAFSPDLAT